LEENKFKREERGMLKIQSRKIGVTFALLVLALIVTSYISIAWANSASDKKHNLSGSTISYVFQNKSSNKNKWFLHQ